MARARARARPTPNTPPPRPRPPSRARACSGGLIFWADLVGAERIVKTLDGLAAKYPAAEGFFAPCEYLRQAAATGRKLGAGPPETSKM